VERDVKQFCGWALLKDIVEAARSIGFKGTRNAGFVATLFNTGGRVSEVLALKPTNFRIFKGCHPPLVVVENMPLLKRYEKTGEYIDENGKRHFHTKRIPAVRNSFSMRVDEPLIKPMLVWIVEAYKAHYEYLFPSPYKADQPLSRKWAYQLMRKIGNRLGIHLYDHWFRGKEQASWQANMISEKPACSNGLNGKNGKQPKNTPSWDRMV
jgi:integrase